MIVFVWKVGALGAGDARLIGRALFTLARVRVSLWTRPWQRVCVPRRRPLRVVAARPDVRRLTWAVRVASHVVPRATCLTQSLALQWLLFHFGYESIVQVGVRNVNGEFAAHAWVEHDGRPLVDSAANLARYTRLFVWLESRPHLP